MTQEEKQELIVSLCSMLAYGVMVRTSVSAKPLTCEILSNIIEGKNNFIILPYLRPMESMTLEEFQGLRSKCPHANFNQTNVPDWIVGISGSDYGRISRVDEISKFIDWLNSHHFDYRGLIPRGLAIEAPEGMYEIVTLSI